MRALLNRHGNVVLAVGLAAMAAIELFLVHLDYERALFVPLTLLVPLALKTRVARVLARSSTSATASRPSSSPTSAGSCDLAASPEGHSSAVAPNLARAHAPESAPHRTNRASCTLSAHLRLS
jgi:hypothetical protein